MRMAVIDCGSNSFRLLIADYHANKLVVIRRATHMVRLGADLSANASVISADTYSRCKNILSLFRELVLATHCQQVICIGTSALRSALNAQEFITKMQEDTGFQIRLISGEQESYLSFLGAVGSIGEISDGCAVLDIGGGSTECSYATAGTVFSQTTKLGAVRLTNMFWQGRECPTSSEQQALQEHVHNTWNQVFSNHKPAIKRMIGVAGTITNLAAISMAMTDYDPELIEGVVLKTQEVADILKNLSSLNLEKRRQIPGLQPGRADIIIAGTIVLLETMQWFGVPEIEVSDHDLLYALVVHHQDVAVQWQPVADLGFS